MRAGPRTTGSGRCFSGSGTTTKLLWGVYVKLRSSGLKHCAAVGGGSSLSSLTGASSDPTATLDVVKSMSAYSEAVHRRSDGYRVPQQGPTIGRSPYGGQNKSFLLAVVGTALAVRGGG